MSDQGFLTQIISEICDYAVENWMEPDDALGTVADNIKALLEISTFNNWRPKAKKDRPRLLTIEEIREAERMDRFFWVQDRDEADIYHLQIYMQGRTFVDFYMPYDIYTCNPDDYGKTWRCWSDRPTEDQMNIPWKEMTEG